MDRKSIELPILNNSTSKCIIDSAHRKWFENKIIKQDNDGYCYYELSVHGKLKKFYVHNNVMIIAVLEGKKEPMENPAAMRRFVLTKADPDVLNWWKCKCKN